MVSNGNIHTSGYETAYKELYSIINSERHNQVCGECRPCGAIQEIVEVLMETLARKLTHDEFFVMAALLARTGTGVRDKDWYIKVDFWGEFNNAVNSDGTYDWPEGCDLSPAGQSRTAS